ncbi:hypothetical protein ACFOD1_05665 [Pseudidiomarina halophila]|uniref:Histidine kinase domain-containing protein n=1 Tax=Pseudidiomarina halophila TaxID=1449799 RepID=A0A432XTP1_9GAMM|nr:hypothetical protein [Pseudidiomarina halophila]RUO51951.1 hypothetical protein CWI69_09935 [Pseudidiomarina halophila]
MIDITIGVVAVAAVLALSLTMPLGIFNAKLTDAFLYISPAPDFTPTTFTIKNTGSVDLTDNEINSLVRQLNNAGAAHILILDNYSRSTTRAYNWPNNVHVTSSRGQDFLKEYPNSLQLFELNSDNGNYRSFSLASADNSILTLLNSNKSFSKVSDTDEQRFFNFAIRPGLLPNITAQQALNGDIIRSLVADKIVFIQVSPGNRYERFYVAESLEQDYQTYVEMQALAVETIVQDLDLEPLPMVVIVLLLLSAYFTAFFLLQVFNTNGILLFEGTQLAIALLLSYLLFVSFQLVFPFGELFLTQLIALLQFLISERRRESQIMSSRTAKLQTRLNQRMLPGSFLQAEDPWKNLHVFIDQHLNMQRSILLDRVAQDHRLVAIHSLNCTIEDIEERRRDFQRAPYSDALQTQRPHRIGEGKSYFKNATRSEIEYIVPLVFAGDVLGFWALTVEPDEQWNANIFEQNLISFSRELAELLYHRSKFVERTTKENRWLRQVVNLNYAVKEHRELDSAIELLERRLGLLQNVFNRNTSALALYNLFGQVLTSNQKMDKIANALDLKIFTMSAHDLLVELTGEQSANIKRLMLQITLHQRTVEWPISSPKLESDYILRVLPIERENNRNDDMSPFLLAGILFEFVDVHSVQQVVERKRELHQYYFNKLEADFTTIRQVTEELAEVTGTQHQHYLKQLRSTLDKASRLSVTVERMLELQQHSSEIIPANPARLITNRVRKLVKTPESKVVKFDYEWPDVIPLVMVSLEPFRQLLDAILNLLVKDVDTDAGVIKVAMNACVYEDSCRRTQILFTNNGYGVPQERLDSLRELTNFELFNEGSELFTIIYLGRQIEDWGAQLELSTELGKGFQIKLLLPTFDADLNDRERPAQ